MVTTTRTKKKKKLASMMHWQVSVIHFTAALPCWLWLLPPLNFTPLWMQHRTLLLRFVYLSCDAYILKCVSFWLCTLYPLRVCSISLCLRVWLVLIHPKNNNNEKNKKDARTSAIPPLKWTFQTFFKTLARKKITSHQTQSERVSSFLKLSSSLVLKLQKLSLYGS